MSEVLKIAVPNKGALSQPAATMLSEAGYRQRTDLKDLVLTDEANHVEFYYLRPRDIAVYVGEGTLDLGITGRDMLLDSHADAEEIMALGFGASRFRFASPAGSDYTLADLEGKRIATSYPGLLEGYLADRGVKARLIHLDGAVESSIRLGVADAIADVVETGTTLRKAGLELFGDPILHSEGILVRRPRSAAQIDPVALEHLTRRLSGVLVARTYVLIDYDIPESLLDRASALTPGLESPTISPLAKKGWVAVRALVPAKGHQPLMDDLYDLGARGILVTELAACRL
ncbi:ATP phosphoribosyltransferase [Brooklawnia cerclae]|uniref:ATP phosphoribosyltransferase n=1 Tax=Brooklawnia cerclae TaxID=349934 RepID=UPI0014205350